MTKKEIVFKETNKFYYVVFATSTGFFSCTFNVSKNHCDFFPYGLITKTHNDNNPTMKGHIVNYFELSYEQWLEYTNYNKSEIITEKLK